MEDEWFRSPAWDLEAQSDFEERLRRARSHSRGQYLYIKGESLAGAGNLTAAYKLWQRVLVEHPSSLHAWTARERLGDVARQQGRMDEAEHWYRQLIEANPTLNATTHMVEVSLAEILIATNEDSKRDEGMRLLQSALDQGGLLNNQLFRWHLALIEAARQLGDAETQQRAARTALRLTESGPNFPRHPTVGLVETDNETIQRLRALADSKVEGSGPRRRLFRRTTGS
ncbi:MAG TPA: tetratricopeptide repeat protein [Acidimicrobiales bacterium]